MGRGSGAFGNTGVASARSDAQKNLLNQLGNTENKFRFQDYTTQQGLAENFLNRNSQLSENAMNRDAGLYGQMADYEENRLNRGFQGEGQRIANMLGMYGNERGREQSGLSQALTYGQQPYLDAQNLMDLGDIQRSYNQSKLDNRFQKWSDRQAWPYQQMDMLANIYRTGLGGGGSTTSSAPNYGASSNSAQNLGMGLAGIGALQGLLG